MALLRAVRLGVLTTLIAVAAQAEPARAPAQPTVISGSANERYGAYTAGSAGATIRLVNRGELRLGPGASVRLFPLPQKLQLSGNTRTPTWTVALHDGRMDVMLPAKTQTALLVTVNDINITTLGGEFSVLSNSRETLLAARAGEVRAQVAKRWQNLKTDQVLIVNSANPSGTFHETLKAPALVPGQRVWFAAETGSISGIKWQAVRDARGYEVRLRRRADGSVLSAQRANGTTLPKAFTNVAPGEYTIALRTVDARGIEGAWSSETPLRVLGLKLPPGAHIAGDRVFMGQKQVLEFTNPEGIEFSHLTSGGYVPAATGIVLERPRSTIVTVRNVGSTDVSVLRVEPRKLFADVHVGPKHAVWPNDPIVIQVELKSGTGQPVPTWLEPVAKVRLGFDPLDVRFSRKGDTLRAVVPPVAGPGPWVLRVEVEDQYGVPLGRDFVEILAAPRAEPKRPAPDPSRSARR